MPAIKRIGFKNHPVLGNLILDFCDKNGVVAKTIILVGENGTGKSKILEALYQYATNNLNFECEIEIANPKIPEGKNKLYFRWNETNQNRTNAYDQAGKFLALGLEPNKSNFLPPAIFSDGNLNLDAKQINAVTSQDIDKSASSRRSDAGFSAKIKQLLVDIKSQDALDLSEAYYNAIAEKKALDNLSLTPRLTRFTIAFNKMFDNLTFSTIKNETSHKAVLFKKNRKEIPIDDLSSGEKQIVYRACFLLQDKDILKGPLVLVDEPELSMHPKWQQKILQYYRDLFLQEGDQCAQMFFATHSEYVLKAALNDRDNILIIALSDNKGVIEAQRITKPSALPAITFEETNYLIFDVISTDYHNQLYGYIQIIKGYDRVKDCDDYIANSDHYDETQHGKPDSNNHGTEYRTLPTFIRNAIDHPEKGRRYNDNELRTSIDLLRKICLDPSLMENLATSGRAVISNPSQTETTN